MSGARGFDPRPRIGSPGVFDVHVPSDLLHFQGHFEGEPILPAVVQVDTLVLRTIAATWPELTRIRRMTRLRFRAPIRPGDNIELRLDRVAEGGVTFEILRDGASCSAGALHFDEGGGA